jgi:hypothetical protein
VFPSITGNIERAGIDQRPVHKVGPGTVGVFVGIEDVDDGEPSDCEHKAVRRAPIGELVDAGVDLLAFAAEIDGLADERALQSRVGRLEKRTSRAHLDMSG